MKEAVLRLATHYTIPRTSQRSIAETPEKNDVLVKLRPDVPASPFRGTRRQRGCAREPRCKNLRER